MREDIQIYPFQDKIQEIAQILGGEWLTNIHHPNYKNDISFGAFNITEHEILKTITIGVYLWGAKDGMFRITFGERAPHINGFHFGNTFNHNSDLIPKNATDSINVSRKKTAQQIASDIKKRLWESALWMWDNNQKRISEFYQEKNAYQDLIQKWINIGFEKQHNSCEYSPKFDRDETKSLKSVSVTLYNEGYSFNVSGLSKDEFLKVLSNLDGINYKGVL